MIKRRDVGAPDDERPWVLVGWRDGLPVEQVRCATWEAADRLRRDMIADGVGMRITIEARESWEHACRQPGGPKP